MCPDRQQQIVRVYAGLDCRRLLDIGCRDGSLSMKIGDACGAEVVHGIDQSEQDLHRARRRDMTVTRVDVDRERLPYEDGSFDSIHSGEVIDYLRDPDLVLGEAFRCLTDGGTFVLSTPNLSAIHNRVALLFGRLPYPLRARYDSLVTSDDHASALSKRCTLFTFSTLQETLRAHGFTIQRTIGGHCSKARTSTIVRLLENAMSRFPRLCYRVIFVCKKESNPADRPV